MALTPTEVRKWMIYKITNPNGRVYIGLSSNIKKRFANYRRMDCKKQKLLYRSLLKYGPKNHLFDIVDSFESTIGFAHGKEIHWIRSYMSNRTKYPIQDGMNMCDGGQGTLGVKKTEDQKRRISIANHGYRHSDESKRKISESGIGNKYNVGKKRSKEHIDKLRIVNTGNKYNAGRICDRKDVEARAAKVRGTKRSEITRQRQRDSLRKACGRSISQYSIDGNFITAYGSIQEAKDALSLNSKQINRVLSGEYKQTNGFTFKYN